VVRHGDLDIQVARRAAAGADLAFAGQLDAGARVDPGRNLEGEGAPGADPTLARALETRVVDRRAVALAGLAGPSRHHLPEEGPLHRLHLAAAVAQDAGRHAGPWLAAVTLAGRASDGGLDGELLLRAEDRVVQVDLDPDEGVLAAVRPRARAALGSRTSEEGVHDVAEREALPAEAGAPTRREGVDTEVVVAPFVRIGEHLVGPRHRLELFLGLGARVDIRVQLAGEPSVGTLDLLRRGGAFDAEVLVVVAHNSFSVQWLSVLDQGSSSSET
jgi:hypothetical protein